MILMGYNYLSKCYFLYQSVFKTGRHQQSLNFDLGMETGILARRATVDQAMESLRYQRNFTILGALIFMFIIKFCIHCYFK